MEEGQSETGESSDSSERKKMEGLSLQFANQPSGDLSGTTNTFFDTNNTLPFTFTGPIHFNLDDLSNLSSLRDDRDNFNIKSNSTKMTENSFSDNKGDLKPFDRSDLADMKGMSPLQVLNVSGFQEHPSPASSATPTGRDLRYQTSGAGGDAMLSAINYNDSELAESAFDMNTTNSTHLDDGIMGNPSQNIRLSEGQGSHTYDLFDGNVNEALSLSPQPFADSGFNVEEDMTSTDGEGSSVLKDQSLSDTIEGIGKKAKKSAKTPFSPLKQNVQCPTCGKGFTNSSALAKHRLTHSEERKYICNVCSKGFKRQDHLNGHLMTHREKKPYECQVENCEKSYCDARSLRRHLETHHRQTPEAIAASVLASMAAAGISNVNQANGKPRASDQRAFQEATQILQMGSPSYSANTTPSPSPSYTTTSQTPNKQVFQFEQQQQGQSSSTQAPSKPPASSSKQNWPQARNPVYNFVSNPFTQPANTTESSSAGYSPVSPVPPTSNAQSTSPILAQHQRQLWFNNTTPAAADMSKQIEEVKPQVTCSICHKKFKNTPALNGHMRLHGGYMKKDKDKDENKKSSNKKTKTLKQTQIQQQPSDVRKPSSIAQLSNIPSLNQGLHLITSPQNTNTGLKLPVTQGVLPSSVQQLSTSEAGAYLHQHHPVLQQRLQLHVLQQKQQQQQQQQNQQQQQQILAATPEAQQNSAIIEKLKQELQRHNANQKHQVSDDSTNTRGAIQQPALLQHVVQGVVNPDQFLQLHQLDPVQQQLVQQQLQQLTVQAIAPQLIQQPNNMIQLQPSLFSQLSPQQIETLQQLQPSQIQQLIQEHHLQQQLQQQEEQRQQQQLQQQQHQQHRNEQQQSVPLDCKTEPTENQALAAPISDSSQVGENTQSQQPQFHLNHQHLQQLAEQMSSVSSSEAHAQNQQILRSHLEQTLGHNFYMGQQDPQSMETSRQQLEQQHHQDRDQIENIELSNISPSLLNIQSQSISMSTAGSIPSSLGMQYDQRQEQQTSSSFLSGNDVQMSGQQTQDVAQLFGTLSDVVQNSSSITQMAGQQTSLSQEEKLSNIQPTINPFTTISQSADSMSKVNTIDSIRRDLMASRPKPMPCTSISTGLSVTSDILQSRNFKPICSGASEVRRRLSADCERTISPQNNHSSLTMLLSKGGPSETFAKPEFSTAASGRVRMRSKSGDDYIRAKLMRSKSVDPSCLMRPRSQTEDSLFRERRYGETLVGRSKSQADDVFSKSDGAGVFRNPGLLTSPIKFKRKHRPAPLFIPPHLNSFQSRLRSPRLWDGTDLKSGHHGHTPPPYTPPPMLSPIRRSSGLFCSIQSARPFSPRSAPITPRLHIRKSSFSGIKTEVDEQIDETEVEEETPPPETDILPHVNVGSQYQAVLPPFNPNKKDALRSISREDVLWEPFAMGDNSHEEVQYYQEFACCAAVHGNGSNVEYALHILYMAKGNIQDAIVMMMDEPPKLPSYHTLLTYNYQESDHWGTEEIENFHKGLNKFDKDFFNVSKEVSTKTVKQCVQFYYLWKKVCPEDHKRLRSIRRKREQEDLYNLRSRQSENPQPVNCPTQDTIGSESEGSMTIKTEEEMDTSKLSDIDMESTVIVSNSNTVHNTTSNVTPNSFTVSSVGANIPILTIPSPASSFTCDYPNCHATFSSKQALSGHRRMHSTSVHKTGHSNNQLVSKPSKPRQPRPHKPRSSPGASKPSPILNDLGEEIFPCRLCDRIFSKVKSRSAHMKSHKMAENERSKNKTIELIKMATIKTEFSQ